MNAVVIPQAVGDWGIKGRDIDQQFARVELSDTCIDAANRTARAFGASYPGWELYSRIVRGDTVFDRRLTAWAVIASRRYARARKVNGHAVVALRGRSGPWIAQAGLDALEFVIQGYYTENAYTAAERLEKDDSQYRQFRGAIAALMLEGLASYQAELHYQYARVRRDESRVSYFGPTVGIHKSPVSIGVRGDVNIGLSGIGCYIAPAANDSENS